MENSFYFMPKDAPEPRDNIEIPQMGFTKILRRIELINGICDRTERSHFTAYPNVVKLCRLCITDVCKELTQRINWETTRFKKYTELFEQLENDTYEYIVKDKESLMDALKISITDTRYLYNEYHTLYQTLKKKKLYTTMCVICEETKN